MSISILPVLSRKCDVKTKFLNIFGSLAQTSLCSFVGVSYVFLSTSKKITIDVRSSFSFLELFTEYLNKEGQTQGDGHFLQSQKMFDIWVK
jgi:hypothetical protein